LENEEEEEEQDGQSFVTAHENENDQLTESVNDLHLGHDDDGEKRKMHMLTRRICFVYT
jgi:hypothetical protein